MNGRVVIVAPMYEFDSVSVSTFEASTLTAKLTEKSSEGWDVVAIVPSGNDITAFLRRSTAESSTSTGSLESDVGATTVAAAAATEPAGWANAPDSAAASSSSGWADQSNSSWSGGAATPAGGTTWGSATQPPTAPAPAAATPAVPAGWYADPALRYELRYWDGSAWTEHVSRAGQQYTDPPVA